ncbi:sugar transferase [Janthinobacterium sp. HLX7-2]|uniref:sugar transferase n=1 Tax=Janthinobacterium sp. HLX7-2 TaxID=1259331 RepID=UPI003F21157E
MKIIFDLILALIASLILVAPVIIVALLVRFASPGSVLYWSDRVRRNNKIFKMPNFRSMLAGRPAVATICWRMPAHL